MTQPPDPTRSPDAASQDDDASTALFHAGALILESRRLLAAFAVVGALTALLIVTIIGPRYSARASFMPQSGDDSDLSALMGIAGQFGLPLRAASSAPSPELYAALISSPVVLNAIAAGSYPVDTLPASSPVPLDELFGIDKDDPRRRHELVVEELQENIGASVDRRTNVISLRVTTRWPTVSRRIAERVLEELNTFNLEKRQSQAKAERIFAEERVVEARAKLAAAEDAARDFAVRNRVVAESPSLRLEEERLDRAVSLRQQLLSSLEQSLESARLREVQDTPVITVFMQPAVRSVPDPRGRVKWTILGGILGLLLGGIVVPLRSFIRSSRSASSSEAARFRSALDETKRQLLGPFGRPTKNS